MVVHVVLFKLKPEFRSQAPQAAEKIQSMKGRIPGLLDIRAGADYLHSGRSWDLALVAHLESPEALDVYQAHEVHQPVKAFMGERSQESAAVDFEV